MQNQLTINNVIESYEYILFEFMIDNVLYHFFLEIAVKAIILIRFDRLAYIFIMFLRVN